MHASYDASGFVFHLHFWRIRSRTMLFNIGFTNCNYTSRSCTAPQATVLIPSTCTCECLCERIQSINFSLVWVQISTLSLCFWRVTATVSGGWLLSIMSAADQKRFSHSDRSADEIMSSESVCEFYLDLHSVLQRVLRDSDLLQYVCFIYFHLVSIVVRKTERTFPSSCKSI